MLTHRVPRGLLYGDLSLDRFPVLGTEGREGRLATS